MTTTDPTLGRWSSLQVPSVRWSPAGELGASNHAPLPLSGSPSVPLPEGFLEEIDTTLAATRVSARGRAELRRAISERIETTSGFAPDPEAEVLITNGAMQGLDVVFRALVPDGASVGMLCPSFFADRLFAGRTRPIRIDTYGEEGWRITDRVLARVHDARLDALFIVNPNNPTGTVLTEAELVALAEATAASDALLVVDEAYEAFVYDGRRHVSMIGLGVARERMVTIQSFTKSFGLVAARVGTVFGAAGLLDPVARLLGWVTLASNPLSQAMALAAMESADSWRPRLISQFAANREQLVGALEAGNLPSGTSVPEGATFSMLDISGMGVGSEEASRRVWRETGIACVPGIEFPGATEVTDSFLRLPIGAPESVFSEALARLGEFFTKV